MIQLYVTDKVLRGRILRWGNSYGIRLRKAEVERAGLKEGAEATVRIEPGRVDLSHLRTYDDPEGRTDISVRHDEILADAVWEDLHRRRGQGGRRHARR